LEVHISWAVARERPLRWPGTVHPRVESDHSPDVSIFLGWINPPIPDVPAERDIAAPSAPGRDEPDEGERTEEGDLHDISGRVEEGDALPDGPVNDLEGVWRFTRTTISEYFDHRHRNTTKFQVRDYFKFERRLLQREGSPWIWWNDQMLAGLQLGNAVLRSEISL
jgi:hypothetical protein